MIRTIYHGSERIIKEPLYGKGSLHNDYGQGFYCTENPDLAKEWAVEEHRDGYANIYRIDDRKLNICDLQSSSFSCLHWLELLISNREFGLLTPVAREAERYLHDYFHLDITDADIVIGYRADDSYFTFAKDFLNNSISLGQLKQALYLGDLGLQYVLKSRKAFEALTCTGYEIADWQKWFPAKQMRDKKARRAYYQMDTMRYRKDDLYILQILDQEVKADDPRL